MKHRLNVKHSANRLTALLVLAGLSLFSACISIRHLDHAQDNFNRGAALENQLRFNPQTEVLTSPSLYYNSAYSDVNKALQKKDDLKKDDLLANALAIKALCEWRLKMYDEAKKSADSAMEQILGLERKGIRLPRDKTLMEALPSLIAVEQAHQSLYALQKPALASLAAARDHYTTEIYNADPAKEAKLEEVLKKIEAIRAKVTDIEDLSLYLVQSELTALKTWSDALDFLRQSANKDASLSDSAKKEAREFCSKQRSDFLDPQKKELIEELSKLLPQGTDDPLVKYWDRLI